MVDMMALTDLVRGTLQCDSLDVVEKCVRALAQSHRFRVARVKNRLDPSYVSSDGYRDVLCNVEINDGCIGEVQINLSSMVDLKGIVGPRVLRGVSHDPLRRQQQSRVKCRGLVRASARCPADEMRPLCLAERVSTGQLTHYL